MEQITIESLNEKINVLTKIVEDLAQKINNSDFELIQEDLDVIKKAREEYLRGETYSWEDINKNRKKNGLKII